MGRYPHRRLWSVPGCVRPGMNLPNLKQVLLPPWNLLEVLLRLERHHIQQEEYTFRINRYQISCDFNLQGLQVRPRDSSQDRP